MWRFIAKHGAQALLVLGPVLTLNWSLLNWLGHQKAGPSDPVIVGLGLVRLSGPKQEIELQLRLLISIFALFIVMSAEIFDLYLPQRSMKEFRTRFLKDMKEDWRAEWGDDFRICILHARRPLLFPLCRFFHWTWDDGFDPPAGHFDAKLTLCEYQGVCGLAFRRMEAQWVDFRGRSDKALTFAEKWLLRNPFHLWPWQIRKTRNIQAVLSVPMLQQTRANGPWRSAGVIALDAVTEEGALLLEENRKALVAYFYEVGKILAWLA